MKLARILDFQTQFQEKNLEFFFPQPNPDVQNGVEKKGWS